MRRRGAAAGYAFALPLADAAPYLAGAAVVALLRGLAGTRRQNYAPMAPATAAGIVFCLIRSGLAVAGYAGLPGILSAAAEALLVLGLSYLLVGFFAVPRQGGMPQDAEKRAALLLRLYGAAGLPDALHGTGAVRRPRRRRADGAGCCGPRAGGSSRRNGRGRHGGAVRGGPRQPVCRAWHRGRRACRWLVHRQQPPGDGSGVLRRGAGGRVLRARQQRGAAAGRGALHCGRGVLPAARRTVPACSRRAAVRPFASRAALTTLSGRLEAVSGALCAVGDTVQAVCERLPPRRETTADLCDAVAERCCKACGKRLYCWVDCAGETYDAFNNLSPLIAMPDGVAAADLPPVLQRRCQTPVRLANAINVAAAEQAARRAARTHDGAARAALCEQYSALAAALAELAGQVYQTDVPDKRKARRLEQLFSEIGLEPLETTVAQDASGRVTATVCVPRLSFTADELKVITDEVSTLCRRTFAPAQCIHSGTVTKLLFRERPRFAVDCAVCAPARRRRHIRRCDTGLPR